MAKCSRVNAMAHRARQHRALLRAQRVSKTHRDVARSARTRRARRRIEAAPARSRNIALHWCAVCTSLPATAAQ